MTSRLIALDALRHRAAEASFQHAVPSRPAKVLANCGLVAAVLIWLSGGGKKARDGRNSFGKRLGRLDRPENQEARAVSVRLTDGHDTTVVSINLRSNRRSRRGASGDEALEHKYTSHTEDQDRRHPTVASQARTPRKRSVVSKLCVGSRLPCDSALWNAAKISHGLGAAMLVHLEIDITDTKTENLHHRVSIAAGERMLMIYEHARHRQSQKEQGRHAKKNSTMEDQEKLRRIAWHSERDFSCALKREHMWMLCSDLITDHCNLQIVDLERTHVRFKGQHEPSASQEMLFVQTETCQSCFCTAAKMARPRRAGFNSVMIFWGKIVRRSLGAGVTLFVTALHKEKRVRRRHNSTVLSRY